PWSRSRTPVSSGPAKRNGSLSLRLRQAYRARKRRLASDRCRVSLGRQTAAGSGFVYPTSNALVGPVRRATCRLARNEECPLVELSTDRGANSESSRLGGEAIALQGSCRRGSPEREDREHDRSSCCRTRPRVSIGRSSGRRQRRPA